MKNIILPIPPRMLPNQIAFNQAMIDWMQRTKNIIEQASAVNDSPLNQNFVVTSGYTMTTAISGTATGTQVSNFICTFINSMINKGLVTQANINI